MLQLGGRLWPRQVFAFLMEKCRYPVANLGKRQHILPRQTAHSRNARCGRWKPTAFPAENKRRLLARIYGMFLFRVLTQGVLECRAQAFKPCVIQPEFHASIIPAHFRSGKFETYPGWVPSLDGCAGPAPMSLA